MAIYQVNSTAVNKGTLNLTEQHLYGSSRLGIYQRKVDVDKGFDQKNAPYIGAVTSLTVDRGNKQYELGNHLGNVMVTVSDRKIAVASASNPLLADHFEAEVVSEQDYCPFGMTMVGRHFAGGSDRYGFNGKENDPETGMQDYGMRIYSPLTGRFLSVDPLMKNFPRYSVYHFAGNNPILNVDVDGLEEHNAVKRFLDFTIDMAPAPKTYKSVCGDIVQSTYNLHGQPVNNLYFWDKFIEKYPNFLDEWNKARVQQQGKSPIFTGALKAQLESQGVDVTGLKIGDMLEHHHINQNRIAVPITSTEHDNIPVQKNPSNVKVYNRFGKFLRGTINVISTVGTEITGYATGNPDAMINQFGTRDEVGKIYKDMDSRLYFSIVSQQRNENSIKSLVWIYSSYEWDNKQKKYVGSGVVGYGTQYEEKSGYMETIVYDLNGKIRSYHSSGTPQSKPL